MITVITGVPGMGKTALVVKMMMDELEKGERPFFVMGIPELKLDHSPVPPVIEWTEKRPDPDDPTIDLDYYTFPKNSIIIIDEAQRVFRPRASSSKVPPHVAAQETHRHTGVDFWLLTQKPRLLDSNIRDLAGRHIHLKKTIMGAYLYEWPEFVDDVKSRTSLNEAVKRKYSPPKESFKFYKSSELHTKQTSRFHQAYVILFFALLMVSFFGYRLYTGLYQKLKNEPTDLIAENIDPDLKKAIDDEANKPLKNQIPQPAQQPLELKHPYRGYNFTIKASIQNPRFTRTYYELNNGVNSVFLTDHDLKKVGYSINQPNDCSAFLFFNGAEITATCSQANETSDARQRGGGYNLPQLTSQNTDQDFNVPYKGSHNGADPIGLF